CSKGVARKALGSDWMVHAALREMADHTRYLGAITPVVRLRPVGKPPWSCTPEESEYRHRRLLRSRACNSASAAHSGADVTTRLGHRRCVPQPDLCTAANSSLSAKVSQLGHEAARTPFTKPSARAMMASASRMKELAHAALQQHDNNVLSQEKADVHC